MVILLKPGHDLCSATPVPYVILCFNTLRPTQNGHHITDDTFKCIFLNGNIWIWITISLKFVPNGPFNNIPTLVQVMAWRRPGDKPLSEPMMVRLPTHICITRPQWVKWLCYNRLQPYFLHKEYSTLKSWLLSHLKTNDVWLQSKHVTAPLITI